MGGAVEPRAGDLNRRQDYLVISGLSKTFSDKRVLESLSIRVARGELVSLLGPSGCGKTTLLRLIAGLDRGELGTITLAGHSLTGTPPHKRNVGVVFQSYALFPHLNVRDNVAFGLRQRGIKDPLSIVSRMLALVHLDEFADRPVTMLSGGQQQRVAVARALATKPDLLLLDEPFSALDKKLREVMQIELRRLLQEVGMTAIFVTHDQDEALALSDRIAVMYAGRIEQFDVPGAIYSQPRTRFVLDFVGQATRWHGRVTTSHSGISTVETAVGTLRVPAALPLESNVLVAVRPEKIALSTDVTGMDNTVVLPLRELVYQGTSTEFHFAVDEADRAVVVASGLPWPGLKPGDRMTLRWKVEDTLVYSEGALVESGRSSPVQASLQ